MTIPGPVLLKRHVRNSKFEPLVDEVELIEANPLYAHVQFPGGREDTVSLKHLAPQGNARIEGMQGSTGDGRMEDGDVLGSTGDTEETLITDQNDQNLPDFATGNKRQKLQPEVTQEQTLPRRSERIRR